MPMEEWKRKKDSSKKRIVATLKKASAHSGKHLDRMANTVHDEVFQKIDCLDCANCCTTIPPIVNRTDSKRIAAHLNMSEGDFHRNFLVTDEDGDTVMKTVPCVFLEADNKCQIYEVRPKACRQYPHTDQSEFSANLGLHKDNALTCPAVFHILEEIGKRLP